MSSKQSEICPQFLEREIIFVKVKMENRPVKSGIRPDLNVKSGMSRKQSEI